MVLIKVLEPKHWPKELNDLPKATWKINDLRIIPSCNWIINRSKEFGYKESFDNANRLHQSYLFDLKASLANSDKK